MKPLTFFADTKIDLEKDLGVKGVTADPNEAILGVLNAVYMWAGIIAVLIIIIAGYLYVTADANASQVKRAKDAVIGAVIGLVVIMAAFVITQFVIGRF